MLTWFLSLTAFNIRISRRAFTNKAIQFLSKTSFEQQPRHEQAMEFGSRNYSESNDSFCYVYSVGGTFIIYLVSIIFIDGNYLTCIGNP